MPLKITEVRNGITTEITEERSLAKLQTITPQNANIVILEMMIMQTKRLIGEKFIEESGISPENAILLEKARNRQIEILSNNLKYAKERNK